MLSPLQGLLAIPAFRLSVLPSAEPASAASLLRLQEPPEQQWLHLTSAAHARTHQAGWAPLWKDEILLFTSFSLKQFLFS